MYRHTHLTFDQKAYISDIITAQNKMRAKLPFILSYKPDAHFQTLSIGNKNKIGKETLGQLLPFKNEDQEFRPDQYLDKAIRDLNGDGGFTDGLSYPGYFRLVTTERCCSSGGSEVNKTLLHRLTLQHEMDNRNRNPSESDSKKADSIIGMLLYLECLRVAEESGNDYLREDPDKTVLIPVKQMEPLNYNDTTQTTKRYGRGLLMLDHPRSQSTYGNPINPEQTVRESRGYTRKPIFGFTRGPKTQVNQQKAPTNLQIEYYELPLVKSQLQASNLQFLDRFSNESNVWKNVSERNYHNKLRESTRGGDSAFYYESPQLPRAFYAKSPSTQTTRKLKNYTPEGYYKNS